MKRKEEELNQSAETEDMRRTRLEARRFHVSLSLDFGDGCVREGEFYYNTLRQARVCVRRNFDEWQNASSSQLIVPPSVWREIWRCRLLAVTIREEEDWVRRFTAQIVDTVNHPQLKPPYCIDCDWRGEFQQMAREGYELQIPGSAEHELLMEDK